MTDEFLLGIGTALAVALAVLIAGGLLSIVIGGNRRE